MPATLTPQPDVTANAAPGVLHRVIVGVDLRAAAADEAEGTFEGVACVPEVVDSYGTTFALGCWAAGGLDSAEAAYALLHMHDPFTPVGVFSARDGDQGLFISGRFDDTRDGRDARVRARSGSMPALSVGFRVLAVDPDDPDRFTQVRLVEVSQITARMAAVPGAGFTAARSDVDAEASAEVQRARARLALRAVRL